MTITLEVLGFQVNQLFKFQQQYLPQGKCLVCENLVDLWGVQSTRPFCSPEAAPDSATILIKVMSARRTFTLTSNITITTNLLLPTPQEVPCKRYRISRYTVTMQRNWRVAAHKDTVPPHVLNRKSFRRKERSRQGEEMIFTLLKLQLLFTPTPSLRFHKRLFFGRPSRPFCMFLGLARPYEDIGLL
ncbi:uncharacterized [Tachysurus ichikawai]